MSDFPPVVPQLLHTVLDAVDVRGEAEFWRDLLGLAYRPGDELPTEGADDADWLVLTHPDGGRCLGGELRLDRTDDQDEPLRAYASPAGPVFCVFVS